MQHSWIVVGVLAVSCLLAGCDSGGGTPTVVTPAEAQAALDFATKGHAAKKLLKGAASPASTGTDNSKK